MLETAEALQARNDELEIELNRAEAAIPSREARLEADDIISAARSEADTLRTQALTKRKRSGATR